MTSHSSIDRLIRINDSNFLTLRWGLMNKNDRRRTEGAVIYYGRQGFAIFSQRRTSLYTTKNGSFFFAFRMMRGLCVRHDRYLRKEIKQRTVSSSVCHHHHQIQQESISLRNFKCKSQQTPRTKKHSPDCTKTGQQSRAQQSSGLKTKGKECGFCCSE